jgi:hypothetical protein
VYVRMNVSFADARVVQCALLCGDPTSHADTANVVVLIDRPVLWARWGDSDDPRGSRG